MFKKKEKAEGPKREHYSDRIVKHRLRRLYQGALVIAAVAAAAAAVLLWEGLRQSQDRFARD